MLSTSVSSLEDTKSYVNQLQAQTAMEKKERARYVMIIAWPNHSSEGPLQDCKKSS